MLKLGLQLYTYIYICVCINVYSVLIEHKQVCLKSLRWTLTALHFICMFILPVRGPLFMDNWRTQIIIPLWWKTCFYYLQGFAMPLCTLTLPPDCLFIIALALLSQWGSSQLRKVPSPFPAFFCLRVTSLCIPPKTNWSVYCLQPGWHASHATEVQHKVQTFGLCPCVWNNISGPVDTIRLHASIVASLSTTSAPFPVMKHWPVMASHF